MLAPLCSLCVLLALLGAAASLLRSSSAAGQRVCLQPSSTGLSAASVDPTCSQGEERERVRTQLLELCDQYKQQQRLSEGALDIQREDSGEVVRGGRPGLFGAGSVAADTIAADERSAEILQLIEKLALLNPTPAPLQGWGKALRDEGYAPCPLGGDWKLRYTNAADATFKRSKRGDTVTSQNVNATTSLITNIIRFPENKGKLLGFDVVVRGERDGDRRLRLDFRRVVIHRRSRFPRLFGTITVPLPRFSVLERFTRREGQGAGARPGPFFEVLYLDDDVRVHRTGEGNVFVQSRLYVLWDPSAPRGWTRQSFV